MILNSFVSNKFCKGVGFAFDMGENYGSLLLEYVIQVLNMILHVLAYGFLGYRGTIDDVTHYLDSDLGVPFRN
jgi:hypothetical protein